MFSESIDLRTFAQLAECAAIVIVFRLDRSRRKQQNLRHAGSLGPRLEIVVPDGSQYLSAFLEFFSGNWICCGFSRKDHRFQPMSNKQKGLEHGHMFPAV